MGVTNYLAKKIANYQNSQSVASRIRARRISPFVDLMRKCFKEYGFCRIIDVGGTRNYWRIISKEILYKYSVTLTIVNPLSNPDALTPVKSNIFVFKNGDGCDLSKYRDNEFHIAHSNSVIEHVGGWKKMTQFASEIRRVAPNYFVQTPNYWFPIEPHYMMPFIHWLPLPMRINLIFGKKLGNYRKAKSIDEAMSIATDSQLLTGKMLASLFPDANFVEEKFFGCKKSFIAIRDTFK